jgi:hypothetical protein
MEVAERRQPLRASKKPLRATGSGQKTASGELGSIDPGVWIKEDVPHVTQDPEVEIGT